MEDEEFSLRIPRDLFKKIEKVAKTLGYPSGEAFVDVFFDSFFRIMDHEEE